MARFRVNSIASLARQMQFTPLEVRAAQLSSTEDLLGSLEAHKAYPLDFVTFKITGYRPKKVSADQIPGLALQHDLGLLIERVSETLDLRADQSTDTVLSIDELTERFNVTSKTIQRWRRRGLAARRFTFPDGKRRVGFLLGSVLRFFTARSGQLAGDVNLAPLTELEHQAILRRARRLAGDGHCCADEIVHRIARKLHRSPLAIRHVLKAHDELHPDDAVLAASGAPLNDEQRVRILGAHRDGLALGAIAILFAQPRSAIYRVFLAERIARLTKRKIKFIDDPLYHQPDAQAVIDAIASQRPLATAPRVEETRLPRDLPSPLADLCRDPLLTPPLERALFLKLNFHKMQFALARRRLDPEFAGARDLNILEAHLERANATRNDIIRANMRLVVSVARRHLRRGLALNELVSDGVLTLMRAVDSFDFHRGNKFSTYATLALMKGYARSVPMMLSASRASVQGGDILTQLPDRTTPATAERLLIRDQLSHLLEHLDQRERQVLLTHYGVGNASVADRNQAGGRQSLSKQRIRQIAQSALTKLRYAVSNPTAE